MNSKALVVLSGGQDSTTCLAMAVKRYGADNVHAITFNYGQRHSIEIDAARTVATLAGIQSRHEVVDIPQGLMASTSPLNSDNELEQYSSFEEMEKIIGNRVEKTFVPMRNALFLNIAANRAVALGGADIYTGVCQADNANYPDCRESFVVSQQETINEALGLEDSSNRIWIKTPLMHMSKDQSIHALLNLCGPEMFCWLAFSHTAYDGQFPPVGNDHATVLRRQGFKVARWPDPLVVRANMMGLMPLPDEMPYKDNETVLASMHAIIEHLNDQLTKGQ